jgi:3-oxocholest-4-en-26-oate---CoA ligase
VARTYNLADLFELVVEHCPDRVAMVAGDRRLTYRQLDERANRLAHHLRAAGIGKGDHVGLQLFNGTEYVEGMLAAFKLGAVPINVNYRYVEQELRYLFDDADLVALVYHRTFGPRVASIANELPKLRHLVEVDDDSGAEKVGGAVSYEEALGGSSADPPDVGRSSDDIYCAYTGGTTGMPKGVLWRHEDIFFGALGGGDPFQSGNYVGAPEELVERVPDTGMTSLATPPLMHVSAHWLAFSTFYGGGKLVVTGGGRFDPDVVWRLVGEESVNTLVVVGDAMARPLMDRLADDPDAVETSSLIVIGSGGAIMSPSTKARISELLPNIMVVDGFGSSETGTVGTRASTSAGGGEGGEGGPRFSVNVETAVLDENFEPVEPGSGVVGQLARRGHIPLGYYNDEEKTSKAFVESGGQRWVLAGDMAKVDDDGTVVVLGRGSVSINTGGEKVYPEEVESVLKAHSDVADALVVGVPDERWGERVTAVVQPRSGAKPTLEEIQHHCRTGLAGYKVPRSLCLVDEVVRSPSGKPDYRWARAYAKDAAATT